MLLDDGPCIYIGLDIPLVGGAVPDVCVGANPDVCNDGFADPLGGGGGGRPIGGLGI